MRRLILAAAAAVALALAVALPATADTTPAAGGTPDIQAGSSFAFQSLAHPYSYWTPQSMYNTAQYDTNCSGGCSLLTVVQPTAGTWQEYQDETDYVVTGDCLTLDDALQQIDDQPCNNLASQLWRSNKVSNGGGTWEIWNEYQQNTDPGYCAGDRSAVISGVVGARLFLACPDGGGGSFYGNNQLWAADPD